MGSVQASGRFRLPWFGDGVPDFVLHMTRVIFGDSYVAEKRDR
jgi:hypothetical protein